MREVAAIVVTYNRKELLYKNITSLLSQNKDKSDIFIIDNASTDGTYEYMKHFIDNKKVFYINTGKNLGGAGGFTFGIKNAVLAGYEYIWLMDDDTIPLSNALEELLQASYLLDGSYGFLSSAVLWTDGTASLMNIPQIKQPWYRKLNYLKDGLLLCKQASFVSLFIKSEVIYTVGLPIGEFFIWADDFEYTQRIARKYDCYIVGKSQVIHEMKFNNTSNIALDDITRIDRYKYAYRNEFYIARNNGFKAFIHQILRIAKHFIQVLIYSKKYRLKRWWIIISSSFRGLFFNPEIQFLKKEKR
ncbi:MAG: glycosyltransferase family 2 protein [Desulfosporosinus sp.]|nr:glycosyltransferase family 2 protein [Desulfosporosinus sp.]